MAATQEEAAVYASSGEYVEHHLGFLTFGRHADGHWGLAHSVEEASEMGFWSIHLDTMGISLLLGILFLGLFLTSTGFNAAFASKRGVA